MRAAKGIVAEAVEGHRPPLSVVRAMAASGSARLAGAPRRVWVECEEYGGGNDDCLSGRCTCRGGVVYEARHAFERVRASADAFEAEVAAGCLAGTKSGVVEQVANGHSWFESWDDRVWGGDEEQALEVIGFAALQLQFLRWAWGKAAPAEREALGPAFDARSEAIALCCVADPRRPEVLAEAKCAIDWMSDVLEAGRDAEAEEADAARRAAARREARRRARGGARRGKVAG